MTNSRQSELDSVIGGWDWTLSNAWFLEGLNTATRLVNLLTVRGQLRSRIQGSEFATYACPGSHR